MPWRHFHTTIALGLTMSACGGSPESLTDSAGESLGAAPLATTPPAGPAAMPAVSVCVQGMLRDCIGQLPTQGTVQNCFAGKQLCSGGTWTACQDPVLLVGVRTQSFDASCPAGSRVRWTTLDYLVDAPSNVSGAAAVTVGVSGHPDLVLLDTRSSNGASIGGGPGSRTIDSLLGSLSDLPGLTLEIATTTTPDGAMAATAKASPNYSCDSTPTP